MKAWKKGAIIGFLFGFLIIGITDTAQNFFCPFKSYGDPARWDEVCPLDYESNVQKCVGGVFMVRSDCLSSLMFFGIVNDMLFLFPLMYAITYSIIGAIIGYLIDKFKPKKRGQGT